MSARKAGKVPLKTEKIEIRVTEDMKEEIQSIAENLGLSVSAFMILCYKCQSKNIFNVFFDESGDDL